MTTCLTNGATYAGKTSPRIATDYDWLAGRGIVTAGDRPPTWQRPPAHQKNNRRVGKTELLRHFCADKPHLFFIATLSADFDQLASFSQDIWRFTHADAPDGFTFPSWETAFRALADLPGRPIVVLDEFTYLISGNRAIPSIG